MGQNKLMEDKVVPYFQTSFLLDRAVLCGTYLSHMGQSSLMEDIEVSYGTEQIKVGQSSPILDREVS